MVDKIVYTGVKGGAWLIVIKNGQYQCFFFSDFFNGLQDGITGDPGLIDGCFFSCLFFLLWLFPKLQHRFVKVENPAKPGEFH